MPSASEKDVIIVYDVADLEFVKYLSGIDYPKYFIDSFINYCNNFMWTSPIHFFFNGIDNGQLFAVFNLCIVVFTCATHVIEW